jgi:hypothetical protein
MAALPGSTDVQIVHKFVSGKADGADGTLVQPSKWNQNENFGQGADGQKAVRDSGQTDGGSWINYDTASLTNSTGAGATVGDVVAISLAADTTVVLDDTVSSLRRFVVALQAPANAAAGAYGVYGPIPGVKAQGAIPAGNYIRKSATTKAVEDTGVAVASATTPPNGTLGFATTAAAGGFVNVFWFAQTVVAKGPTIQVFTSGTPTYTAPAGLVKARVTVVGGGGGGAGGGASFAGGGGGGGGAAIRWLTAAQIGATQAVTVGGGGASAVAGSTSSFGALLSATGGGAGGVNNGAGVLGGIGSTGDVNLSGGPGLNSPGAAVSGAGGCSAGGYGGGGNGSATAGVGVAGQNFGGGGGGGITGGNAGGAGAGGVVFVEEFYA